MKKMIFFLISLFILGMFSFTFSDKININDKKTKSEKLTALIIEIDNELLNNCKEVGKKVFYFNYYNGRSSFRADHLNIHSISYHKNIELSELCPQDYKNSIDEYFEDFKEKRIIINNSFITFENGSFPLIDISFVSGVNVKSNFNIESLNVNRSIYSLKIKTINDEDFTVLYINKELAEIDRLKIINKDIDFSKREGNKS